MGTKADHGEVRTKYQAPSPLRPILFIHFISSPQINKPHEQTAEVLEDKTDVLPDAGIHCICSANQRSSSLRTALTWTASSDTADGPSISEPDLW